MTARDPLRIDLMAERSIPSRSAVRIGSWTAHVGDGHVRRINSVALHGEEPGPDEIVARLETIQVVYSEAGLRPMIRQTSLDPWIEEHIRFWTMSGESVAMVADPAPGHVGDTHHIEDWVGWIGRLSNDTGRRREAVASVRKLRESNVVVFEEVEGRRVGSGRAVSVDGYCGLFDIQVLAEHRRKGLGRRITRRLMAWAAADDAHTVYLQVAAVNMPARELYGSLGFAESYRYRYRRPA